MTAKFNVMSFLYESPDFYEGERVVTRSGAAGVVRLVSSVSTGCLYVVGLDVPDVTGARVMAFSGDELRAAQ